MLSIKGTKFYINGKETYSEISNCPEKMRGTLMNARFIQGIFDVRENREQFDRFGKKFDPEQNTDDLIKALPEWYAHGMRAFTVGLQGGGPCFTSKEMPLFMNNPYGTDGKTLDEKYANRLLRLISAAQELGMVVIVSLFYMNQYMYLESDEAIRNAVATVSRFLKNSGYQNVIIEIVNEQNLKEFKECPLLYTDDGIIELMELARKKSGGMPVGCSGGGNYFSERIGKASDVVLIHGNGLLYEGVKKMIKRVKEAVPDKPIVMNEDSSLLRNMTACVEEGISWGYYNNISKQEPPADWRILNNEDTFFAYHMAKAVGIEVEEPAEEFIFCGLEEKEMFYGHAWPRVACLHEEEIESISYYRNEELVECVTVEPFAVHQQGTWLWHGISDVCPGEMWEAVIAKKNGEMVRLQKRVGSSL